MDFGEPFYVQAHGGKNDVILYRLRSNPDLAIEFFFRSSSKDGRSRYYRCTNCWYLYKQNRGTCATLIVRDGRIITDPEHPVVPHQCDFKTLEAVAANRSWIASRKRRVKSDTSAGGTEMSNKNKRASQSELKVKFNEALKNLLPDYMESCNSQWSSDSESSNCAVDESPRSSSFSLAIDAAFNHSIKNEYEEALSQLKIAYNLKEAFDIDDVSLVDNVFACRLNATVDPKVKLVLCEEWLDFLLTLTIPSVLSSRWLAPYQFSIYYCFHLGYLLFLRVNDVDKKKLSFYKLARTFYSNILDVVDALSEPMEERVILKLDILIAISYIYAQYCDVSGDAALAVYVGEQLAAFQRSLPKNLSLEVMNSVSEKTIRINKNLIDELPHLSNINLSHRRAAIYSTLLIIGSDIYFSYGGFQANELIKSILYTGLPSEHLVLQQTSKMLDEVVMPDHMIRFNINLRERCRMHDLNEGFDDLRAILPYTHGNSRKLSKIATLLLAKNYILMQENVIRNLWMMVDRSSQPQISSQQMQPK